MCYVPRLSRKITSSAGAMPNTCFVEFRIADLLIRVAVSLRLVLALERGTESAGVFTRNEVAVGSA